jgi:hypothetical protein
VPSQGELESEAVWRNEFTTDEMDWLAEQICDAFDRPRNAAGTKGDTEHLYGAHRSRNWVRKSRFCTNRSYTVSTAVDKAGSGDAIAALDFTPGSVDSLITICKRLDAAVRAGLLEEVTEWYGNIDGNQVVDGWDNVANQAASSDSSHLWHLHMTIGRKFTAVRAVMERILAVLTGKDIDTMTPKEFLAYEFSSPGLKIPDQTVASWLKAGEKAFQEVQKVEVALAATSKKTDALTANVNALTAKVDGLTAALKEIASALSSQTPPKV